MATCVGRALRTAMTVALLGGCSRGADDAAPPDLDVTEFKLVGSNCAGVAPVMHADDGQPRPAQSVLAHYYAVLDLYRVLADDRPVYQTDVPATLRSDVAYRTWQAKTVEILADVGETGFADRWYDGTFGIRAVGDATETCERVEPESYRRDGLLAHTALLQAGQCGENSDGDPKFWEVRPLGLLWIGATYDVDQLVADGLAAPVTSPDHGQCLVWHDTRVPVPGRDGGNGTGCAIAYRTPAVTEAVVFDVGSDEVVSGVPIERRAFTARGEEPLPNGLDAARQVLRSDQFAVAAAIGQPVFAYAGWYFDPSGRIHHRVILVGHRVGPLETPNELLRDEERRQVEGLVGTWPERCCSVACTPDPIPGHDAGIPDAGHDPRADASLPPDAGLPDAGPYDAGPRDAGGGEAGPIGGEAGPVGEAGLIGGLADDGECGECEREGLCVSGFVQTGVVVVVTDRTVVECGGDCPHPSPDPPGEEPLCVP
jgi:hypothetical protein